MRTLRRLGQQGVPAAEDVGLQDVPFESVVCPQFAVVCPQFAPIAAEGGATVNQLINVAVEEKAAALRTADYFRGRAARGDLAEFDHILAKAGSEPPRQGDEGRGAEEQR